MWPGTPAKSANAGSPSVTEVHPKDNFFYLHPHTSSVLGGPHAYSAVVMGNIETITVNPWSPILDRKVGQAKKGVTSGVPRVFFTKPKYSFKN